MISIVDAAVHDCRADHAAAVCGLEIDCRYCLRRIVESFEYCQDRFFFAIKCGVFWF